MNTYSVAELARLVARAISRALPEEIWVQGEIRDLSRASSGHVYFTLVDTNPEDNPPPVLPVTLFASDKVAVNRVLQRSGAIRMTDGVEVRIRGQVSHYAARGTVQLRMTWIDTEFTLGRLAADRERLIKSLEARGLLQKNRSLPLPVVPLRLGLLTSAGSAAEADFLDELESSGFAWRVSRFDARVQGPEAPLDIATGLRSLAERDLDAIAVVRGGGARTDLVAFDTEEVAVAIAECPIPVLTGVGHEIDVSVADLVARSHKTPTACAAALVGVVRRYLDSLERISAATASATRRQLATAGRDLRYATGRLTRAAESTHARSRSLLEERRMRMVRAGRSLLWRRTDVLDAVSGRVVRAGSVQADGAEAAVDRMAEMIGSAAMRATTALRAQLEEAERRLELLDPERLLARGWSITRTEDGTLITDPDDVEVGVTLRTTLAGGSLASVVTEEEGDG